jgi:hypothetical protein
MKKSTPFKIRKAIINSSFIIASLLASTQSYSQAWTMLKNLEPNYNFGVMLLLTDGTVIAHNSTGGTYGTGWDKLTPDASGSYVNGTWTTIASMNYDRAVFPTQVFPNGKVLAAGGEYGSGATRGEVYDPVANTWTNTGAVTSGMNIYDGNSQILANGEILVGPQLGSNPSYDDLYYNVTTNTWSTAPIAPLDHDEAAWLKLPDYSILFVGISTTKSCRFIQSSSTWVSDANLPVQLYDPYGSEAGAAIMLPNGKAIFFGATGHNAIYTPSGTSSPGSWVAAPDFPKIQGSEVGTVDAPACMEPDGKILCAVSPVGTSAANEFLAPTYFVEYDYTTNTFSQVHDTIPGIGGDSIPIACYQNTMLMLPNGQVLLGINQSNASQTYWVYTPKGANLPQGKPVLNSVTKTGCGTYKITGKLFNGISEGAAFGDDWAMSTNYPLVRLTMGSTVYYCKTTNWNRIGAVQTDSLEDTAYFALPATLLAGTYTLNVVVNGIPSSNSTLTPYGITATVTSEVKCNGDSDAVAQVVAQGGSSPYTYKWTSGSTSSTATGLSAGNYTVTVKDNTGCTETASVIITQPLVLHANPSITATIKCYGASTGAVSVTASFGTSPYSYLWSNGGTTSSQTGLSAGTYTVTVTDANGCTKTASENLTQPTQLSNTAKITANVKCNGTNTGSGSSTVTGGTSPYTYAWTGGGTSSSKTGLSAGSYTVTVTDKNGCTATSSLTITQPTALSLTKGVDASSISNCNGKAWVTVSGGTSPYSYAWTPGGATTDTAKALCAGSYCCTVTDKNGCIDSSCISVVVSGIQEINGKASAIKIYPDPNNGYFTVTGVSKGQIVELYNYIGQQISTLVVDDATVHFNIFDKPSGVYLLRVITKDGQLVSQAKLLKVN